MAGEKLVKLMRKSAANAIPRNTLTDIVPGQVVKVDPIRILIENKFEVDEDFLIFSPFCKEFKTEDGLKLFDKLKVGEKVLLLRISSGQQFYVMDRGDKNDSRS
ncbi:MAG: DUF2577 domain-containing protein [Clostridium sp.]|uniref:DUF2577 domain-containing protein n=1 Tax=Clostridium chrysemydis TaxID=2665504 RepID=UPI0018834C20|nr:DUF2577 domain-containing protein [Clostridium chrysemydis]